MSKAPENLFLCKTDLSRSLDTFLTTGIHKDCIVLWLKPDVTVQNADELIGFSTPSRGTIRAAIIVYEGIPIDVDALTGWRTFLLRELACEVRCLFLSGTESTEEVAHLFQKKASNLIGALKQREPKAVGIREWVRAPERPRSNTLLLTMFFDSLGELLTQMDSIKKRFEGITHLPSKAKTQYHDRLESLLQGEVPEVNAAVDELNTMLKATRHQRERIPRVLLLGETGVGKTLFAGYLGNNATPVTRLSVAEFIDKEDMFEYALFGYCRGAYTSAKESGDAGLLLNNIGGVLFLDEIGTATPAVQAKLLAYLDDFMVRPRGATYSLFCPVLVVAATNEDVLENPGYRQDLLQRFTDVHHIPPLRQLKHNFRYILDSLLQSPAINPEHLVREIGEAAYGRLADREYASGNFRELGNVLRDACQQAASSGRDYLVADDVAIIRPDGFRIRGDDPA